MANDSIPFDLPPLPEYTLRPRPSLLPPFPDNYLALLLPIVAYWVLSMTFHYIDEKDYFPQYRLHTPAEVLKRNRVARWDVFRDVVLQQIIQTIVGAGLYWFDPPEMMGKEPYDVAVWARRLRLVQRAIPSFMALVGIDAKTLSLSSRSSNPMIAGMLAGGYYPKLVQTISIDGHEVSAPAFATWELLAAKAIYWVIIPALQFSLAVIIMDTWQYFLHRAMHMNKWAYNKFHSRHHRLYVPYAYGALYNHPFEGFLLDTVGASLGYLISGMSTRQSICFFVFSTIKTVDDHCGYALPWDPLQRLSENNAGYHDIHHQSWGIKSNFSQPFLTFWDHFMGTRWVGGDVSGRYEKSRKAVEEASTPAKEPQPSTTATGEQK